MVSDSAELDVVGVFPALNANSFGGVQAAGREAWRGIVERVSETRARALWYESGASKAKVAIRAFGLRGKAKVLLVWHLHLLKLVPFLNSSGSRVILILHGIEAWRRVDPVTRFLLTRVDLVLTDSDHTWSRFVECNPMLAGLPHRTLYLGGGASLGTVTPAPIDPPAVLMISRLDAREDYKGHRQMIEAWPRVVEREATAQLWIVGDGDLRLTLEKLARRSRIEGSVRFFGAVSDHKKERLIASSRCLAMPSTGEGFGLVYLEAMRLGRPCLVSDCDSGREVINPPEAGLAVSPADLNAIAVAVNRMLTPGPEWEQWSARARSRYETYFTSERYQERFLNTLFDQRSSFGDRSSICP